MATVAKGIPTLVSLWSQREPVVQLSEAKVVEACAMEEQGGTDSEMEQDTGDESGSEMSEHDPMALFLGNRSQMKTTSFLTERTRKPFLDTD